MAKAAAKTTTKKKATTKTTQAKTTKAKAKVSKAKAKETEVAEAAEQPVVVESTTTEAGLLNMNSIEVKRMIAVAKKSGLLTTNCLLYTSPSPRD